MFTDQLSCLAAPSVLVTVDNGNESFEGVATARRLGLQVLVTDHHHPPSGSASSCYLTHHADKAIDIAEPLKPECCQVELMDVLHQEVWGQGFAAPTFSEEVEALSLRLIGKKHLALKHKHQGRPVDGIWFGQRCCRRVKLSFRLDTDGWNGVRRVHFLVEASEL